MFEDPAPILGLEGVRTIISRGTLTLGAFADGIGVAAGVTLSRLPVRVFVETRTVTVGACPWVFRTPIARHVLGDLLNKRSVHEDDRRPIDHKACDPWELDHFFDFTITPVAWRKKVESSTHGALVVVGVGHHRHKPCTSARSQKSEYEAVGNLFIGVEHVLGEPSRPDPIILHGQVHVGEHDIELEGSLLVRKNLESLSQRRNDCQIVTFESLPSRCLMHLFIFNHENSHEYLLFNSVGEIARFFTKNVLFRSFELISLDTHPETDHTGASV